MILLLLLYAVRLTPPALPQNYTNHSPSVNYAPSNDQISADGASHHLNSQRIVGKYSYSYPMHNGSNRDGQWHTPTNCNGTHQANTSSHPGSYANSPTLTSPTLTSPTLTSTDMYRYPVEDQKIPMNNLDTAPYVFPNSRSLSPTSSTPPSSSSTSLTTPFYNFTEGSVPQERPEYDYRRQHTNEVSLHSGGPDISLAGPGSDALRYRMGARRQNSGGERTILPALPPFSGSDNGSQNDRGSSEGESGPYPQRDRVRRDTVGSSRSPSPNAPPISGTLAVIKAQAFGALRRTRTRQKKGDGASRAAMEALESRGLGMGLGVSAGNKRQRLDDDEGDMQ